MSKDEIALVKTPHKRMTYTVEQIQEFQACADPVTGPMYFMAVSYTHLTLPTKA